MTDLAIASLALLGVIVGAALQFWLSRFSQRERHINELRAEAYADYLRAVALAAHLTSDVDLVAALRAAADAKARIVVYGTAAVVNALARYEETGAILSSNRSRSAFVDLVSAMRPERDAVADRTIQLVLLGTGHELEPEVASARR